jgi:hypothetical protein
MPTDSDKKAYAQANILLDSLITEVRAMVALRGEEGAVLHCCVDMEYDELQAMLATALVRLAKATPRSGWIKASQ